MPLPFTPQSAVLRHPKGLACLAGLMLALAAVPAAHAADQSLPTNAASADRSDVSQWGLGAAVGSVQQPYAGMNRKNFVLPVLYFENRWARVLGTAADVKLPGLDMGSAGTMSFGLRAKYENAGYKADDAPILFGMADRKDGVWLGATATWRNDVANVSAEWLGDTSSHSKGQKIRLGIEKSFAAGQFRLTPRTGIVWSDKKYVDYYYGVRASEARADRSAYSPSSNVNVEVGLRVDYALTQQQSLFADLSVAGLGKEIKNSPLVNRSTQNALVVGYVYRF